MHMHTCTRHVWTTSSKITYNLTISNLHLCVPESILFLLFLSISTAKDICYTCDALSSTPQLPTKSNSSIILLIPYPSPFHLGAFSLLPKSTLKMFILYFLLMVSFMKNISTSISAFLGTRTGLTFL